MAEDAAFLTLIDAIVAGDTGRVARQLRDNPQLATTSYGGSTRRANAPSIFYPEIAHYMYGGDTPLHLAAAALRPDVAGLLIAQGANVRATNRRGAEPLHYAADANGPHAESQAATIRCLIAAGADPNAVDRSGVAPLHRAVRTRSAAAVRALLDGGADIRQTNGSGSTPLFLARRNTGKSGSGSPEAREQRALIEELLIERGGRT